MVIPPPHPPPLERKIVHGQQNHAGELLFSSSFIFPRQSFGGHSCSLVTLHHHQSSRPVLSLQLHHRTPDKSSKAHSVCAQNRERTHTASGAYQWLIYPRDFTLHWSLRRPLLAHPTQLNSTQSPCRVSPYKDAIRRIIALAVGLLTRS